MMMKTSSGDTYQAIYAIVVRIPFGFVATYGQIALLAGYPGCARQAGYALAALENNSSIPWHRVVNARGCISPRSNDGLGGLAQRSLLEAEDVCFDDRERIDLKRFQWRVVMSGDKKIE